VSKLTNKNKCPICYKPWPDCGHEEKHAVAIQLIDEMIKKLTVQENG